MTETPTTLENLADAELQKLSKEDLVQMLIRRMTIMEMINLVEHKE